MKRYEIVNRKSGLCLGEFNAETPEGAMEAMLAQAGAGSETPSPELMCRDMVRAAAGLCERFQDLFPDASADPVVLADAVMIVTQGTGEGVFAYTETEFVAGLDAAETLAPGTPTSGRSLSREYAAFCEAAEPADRRSAAVEIWREVAVTICSPGSCAPLLSDLDVDVLRSAIADATVVMMAVDQDEAALEREEWRGLGHELLLDNDDVAVAEALLDLGAKGGQVDIGGGASQLYRIRIVQAEAE